MSRLVSLDRVKHYLNMIHSHDDAKLDMLILAASEAVQDYLGGEPIGEEDSDGNVTGVPELEQVATAILVRKLYDGMTPDEMLYGRLPIEVTTMLYIRRRDLGLA